MKKHKKLAIIIGIVLILIVAGELFYINRHNLYRSADSRCPVALKLTPTVNAALPPQSPNELAAESQLVVQGEVCKVVKTYTDGDEKRDKLDKEYGKGKWVGGGTANSQDIIIRVESVTKGNTTKKELQVRKPISAYILKEGDKGAFYIRTNNLTSPTFDGTLLGEYWPPQK